MSNTAVAVHPDVTYVVATDGTEQLVVAEPLLGQGARRGLDADRRVVHRPRAGALDLPARRSTWSTSRTRTIVVLADYVTTDDGTGLVHQSPAFGADDLASCRAYGLPMVNPVRPDGTFEPDVPLVGGVFFKKADEPLVADLQRARPAVPARAVRAQLPALLALPHRADLLRAAVLVHPHHRGQGRAAAGERDAPTGTRRRVKHGRYGDWLNNNVDWALSRSRYWGTPLPIWRCADEPPDLRRLAGRAERADRHRTCPTWTRTARSSTRSPSPARAAAQTATRVPEVIDAWYDSGSMPFAQFGYPYQNKELFEQRYPAQFISEAIDQTRGWFYTLMAVGTLVFDRSSYENVVCLGHILAEDGRKMSKHLGNILEPIPLMDQHGADAVRWFMAAVGSPVVGPPGRAHHASRRSSARRC